MKFNRYIIFNLAFLIFNSYCIAQSSNRQIDSLVTLLKTDKEDTNKVKHLIKLCQYRAMIGDYDKGLVYGKQALALATAISRGVEKSVTNPIYKTALKGISQSYNNIGNIYFDQGNYPESLKSHFEALKIRKEILDKSGMASSYNNIGNTYINMGNYLEALRMQLASLKIKEEIGDRYGTAGSYNNLGAIYMSQGNYSEALKNHVASLKIMKELNDNQGVSNSYNNIGAIYKSQRNYPEALKNHFASLEIAKQMGDKNGIASSCANIGAIYTEQGNYPEALKNYLASLKVFEEVGDSYGFAGCFINLGKLYTKLHKTKEAQSYLTKGLQLSKEIGGKGWIKDGYAHLTLLDSVMGNYKAAFEHHKLYILYRDSLNNEESQKQSLQASMQYEFDKKEIAAKAEQEKKDAIVAEEKQKQKIVIGLVSCVLALVVLFSFFLYKRFRITNKQKLIIEQQKTMVDKAYEALHEKNKEVMDSINYASRIQRALLTTEKQIAKSMNRLTKK